MQYLAPVAGALLVMGCGSTEPKESRSLMFDGVVVDAATQAPIAGAQLAVADGSGFGLPTSWQATTDAQGHYTLSYACINNPYVDTFKPGYFFGSVAVACRVERQTLNISLTKDPNAP